MIGYRFLTPADIEMTEASIFYEDASSGLGIEFLDEVQRVIDLVRKYPKIGQPLKPGFRQALLRRFPFSLIYSIEADAILIVAVAHQRRRPGYWKYRV
jgi:hypothetical protein